MVLPGLGFDTTLAAPNFDGRTLVDAMEYPWSALGRVNAGGQFYCTGSLIGERHVLTRATCLYNATEGRWWHSSELHFIAGYQRDSYQIHSAVARYDVAPRFGTGKTLANLMNNWALLTLEEPIGLQAGWMALQPLDQTALDGIERGTAYVVMAGYRPGQPHVITVTFDCSFDTLLRRELVERGACRTLLGGAGGLSKLVFIDGQFRALAPRMMPRRFVKAVLNGHALHSAHAPGNNSPASRLPRNSIAGLLKQAGYASGVNGHTDPSDLRAAIMTFEKSRGLPVTGRPSVKLLGLLLFAAGEADGATLAIDGNIAELGQALAALSGNMASDSLNLGDLAPPGAEPAPAPAGEQRYVFAEDPLPFEDPATVRVEVAPPEEVSPLFLILNWWFARLLLIGVWIFFMVRFGAMPRLGKLKTAFGLVSATLWFALFNLFAPPG